MNLKSTLWTLAFATIATTWSCSDDVVDPNGGNGDKTTETAKVNVVISTEAVTKATPGEDGDGKDKAEIGEEKEYTVKDVTLILYSKGESDAWTDLKGDYKLIGAGWTDQVGIMNGSDATTPGENGYPNGKMTTVEVKVTDPNSQLLGNTYGVLAVANLGETDGKALVGKISPATGEATYKTVANLDDELFKDQIGGNFVMSTHSVVGSEGNSTVTFTSNASDIPTTSVYVERLSAKVRISPYGTTPTYTYSVGNATDGDEVVLNSVAIVNRLSSGSYLLKRVSATMTSDLTADASTDVLIGDEDGSSTTAATKFVIDPWTRSKTKDALSNLPTAVSTQLSYTNQFTETTYGALWTGYGTNVTDLDLTKVVNGYQHLCYTQENTHSIASSLNGYTTGAIFKATYFPKKWSQLQSDGSVQAKPITYETTGEDPNKVKTPKTFYTYEGSIFEDYKAILAYVIGAAGKDDNISYNSFSDATAKDFGENIAKISSYDDPFGYIKAMKAEYDKTQTTPAGTAVYKTPEDFLASFELTDDTKAAFNVKVQAYTNGVCYYPYWIRHADNENDHKMGVMEFSIVRNNIYDLQVAGINKLGLSEVEPTDPDNPDEDGSARIKVRLFVKNWVVRSNSGIIF